MSDGNQVGTCIRFRQLTPERFDRCPVDVVAHRYHAARIGIQLDNGRKLGFDADSLVDALRALGLRI
jgi:hypothetical protein